MNHLTEWQQLLIYFAAIIYVSRVVSEFVLSVISIPQRRRKMKATREFYRKIESDIAELDKIVTEKIKDEKAKRAGSGNS